jgi:very-short-patch-repair endonuclease
MTNRAEHRQAAAHSTIEQGRQINPDLMRRCESPLEELYLATWLLHVPADRLEVQATLTPYRVDFLVTGSKGRYAVEVDGIEFHRGGNLERARADVRRDRTLLISYGIPTLRFMGSEVAKDPLGCVQETCRAAGLAAHWMTGPFNRLEHLHP